MRVIMILAATAIAVAIVPSPFNIAAGAIVFVALGLAVLSTK